MAAFTPEDPHDRQRFDAHMSRVMKSPENTSRAITWKGDLVGSIPALSWRDRPRSRIGWTARYEGVGSLPRLWPCSWK